MPKIKSQEELDKEVESMLDASQHQEDSSLSSELDNIFEKGVETETLETQPQDLETSKEKEKPEEEKKEEVEVKPEEQKEEEKAEEKKEEKEEEKKEEEEKQETEEKKEVSEKERQLLEKYKLTKFKSIEDALEAYKNLESAYGKTLAKLQAYQKGVLPEEVDEGIETALKIVSKPVVSVNLPDVEGYQDEEGNFRIADYVKDVLEQYTVELQKSLVFGPLASAVYTVQKTALEDKYRSIKEADEIDRQATEVYRELEQIFPKGMKDQRKVELFQRAVLGEAQLKKETLTKDDILRIAGEIFGSEEEQLQPQQRSVQEKTTVSAQVTEKPTPAPKNEIEKAVEEIFDEAVKRSQVF